MLSTRLLLNFKMLIPEAGETAKQGTEDNEGECQDSDCDISKDTHAVTDPQYETITAFEISR